MGSSRQQRVAKRYGWRRIRQMSTDDELVKRVRTLRAQGCTPKQIARTVGVPAARVTA